MKTINLKDLVFVLLYGLVLPFLAGILLGLADYLVIDRWGITLAYVFFWITTPILGSAVRKQYETPQILYSVIAGIGMLFFGVVLLSVPTLWAYFASGSRIWVLLDLNFYWTYLIMLLNPVTWFTHFRVGLLLHLLTLAVGIYLGVKRTL